jgi:hypothetical protein
MRNSALALAVLFVCLAAPLAHAALNPQIYAASSSPRSALGWVPVAGVAVLAVLVAAAFIYMLSSVVASPNARNWAKIQIYETLLSMLMLLFFAAFSYLFFVNPQTAYQSINLVPGSTTAPAATTQCTGSSYNSIFALSMCDLTFFNGAAYQVGDLLLFVPVVTGLFLGVSVGVSPTSGISVGFNVLSLLPPSLSQIFSMGFKVLMTLMILNQIQLLLLAGSVLFLSFFVTLGLFARTLGFSRSFGGAMIALGLGLGLVYPLLVSMTYGFVDYQLQATGILGSNPAGWFVAILTLYNIPFTSTSSASISLANIIKGLSYFIAGFTFIPFLNFMVLDAFIVDLSRALGEKLDFMSLLSGII